MILLKFVVMGEPQPKPRPRAARIGAGIRIYSPETEWAKDVAGAATIAALDIKILDGPLGLDVQFIHRRPASRKRDVWKITRGDVDNFVKQVMDSMNDAGVWVDDARVVELSACKRYTRRGERPCTMVKVYGLEDK